jgi:hypothetical protein
MYMFTQRYAFRKIYCAKGASPFETPTRSTAASDWPETLSPTLSTAWYA